MKCKSLLILFLVFAGLGLKAQTLTPNWQKDELSFPWFTTAINLNGLAYNPVTNKLYIGARGSNIYIIDPATGEAPAADQPQTLSTVGVAASSFNFQKIAVTSTGEIFAITLAPTAGPTLGKCSIYYWTSEADDEPALVSNDISWLAERAGDTFAVTGSGDDVVMYVGGINTLNVQVIAKNTEGKFVKVNTIKLDNTNAGLAAGAIAPVTTGITSDIWVSGFNGTTFFAKRKYSSTGARLATPLGDQLVAGEYTVQNSISKKFLGLKYFEIGSKQFLAVTGAYHNSALPTITGEEVALHIYDITNVTNDATSIINLVATVKMNIPTLKSNVIPTAHVDLKRTTNADQSVTMQFFHVVNHNAFAAHTITFKPDGTLPVSLSSFTASLVNNQNQLTWSTASETNNSGFEIENSQDGKSFNKIGFVASKATNSSNNLNYSFVDKLAKPGTTYYRLKQVDLDGKFSYSDVKFINSQLSAINAITVYPNPTEDFVEVSGLDLEGVTIGLFTTNGTQVKNKGLVEGNKVIMKDLNAGIYILKISKNGKLLQSTKVVKR